VPRGLEDHTDKPQEADGQSEAATRKLSPSLAASQNSEQLCFELSEIVSARPKLSPEIRNAILMLLRAVKRDRRRGPLVSAESGAAPI
jgi:flagellar basal body-associated protein FliL